MLAMEGKDFEEISKIAIAIYLLTPGAVSE